MAYNDNIDTARRLRGMTQTALADACGVSRQVICDIIAGKRNPGPSMMPKLVAVLRCDPAYLRGEAQTLIIRDFVTGDLQRAQIMAELGLDGYGTLYLVDHPAVGWLPVIIGGDGVQLTPADWQSGYCPETLEEVSDGRWVDARGRDAIMLDGLPRVNWG